MHLTSVDCWTVKNKHHPEVVVRPSKGPPHIVWFLFSDLFYFFRMWTSLKEFAKLFKFNKQKQKRKKPKKSIKIHHKTEIVI